MNVLYCSRLCLSSADFALPPPPTVPLSHSHHCRRQEERRKKKEERGKGEMKGRLSGKSHLTADFRPPSHPPTHTEPPYSESYCEPYSTQHRKLFAPSPRRDMSTNSAFQKFVQSARTDGRVLYVWMSSLALIRFFAGSEGVSQSVDCCSVMVGEWVRGFNFFVNSTVRKTVNRSRRLPVAV